MRTIMCVMSLAVCTTIARADLQLWSGTPTNVNITGDTAEILDAGTYKFQSVDGGGNLEGIDLIFVNSSVTGTVTVFIERSTDNNSPGATFVGEIRLDNSNGTASYAGSLAELRITGELGVNQPTLVRNITGPMEFDNTSRSIKANNFFNGSIEANSMGDLTVLTASTALGNLTIHGNHAGSITVPSFCSGIYLIEGNYTGFASFGGAGSNRTFTGTFTVGTSSTHNLTGRIQMANLTAPNGRIVVLGDADNTSEPPIRITNSITGTGASAALISIGDQLNGTIAIDGALANASSTAEIAVTNGTLGALGAIAINYNGESSVDDDWASGAAVSIGGTSYTGNDRSARVWNISRCKGDMNGDRSVSSADSSENFGGEDNNPYADAQIAERVEYRGDYPGLEGSADHHGDANFSGGFSALDDEAFAHLVSTTCCLTSTPSPCPGDVGAIDGTCRFDYDVDISDLSALLGNFGTSSGATRCQGDLTGNGVVDLSDLAELLAHFGEVCCPLTCCSSPSTASVTISVDGFDTGAYSGGGFEGEKYHFVLDAIVTINDSSDDWIGSGVSVTAANSATFLLVPSAGNPPVPGSSVPEKYATFFSVPYSVNANGRFTSPFPTGGIAGKYTGSGGYTYSTTAINAAWYDLNSTSNDGPAAVFRIVIDISAVSGANQNGFGSVYFTTGTPGTGDIKVADMTFDVEHKFADSGNSSVVGAFYLTD